MTAVTSSVVAIRRIRVRACRASRPPAGFG
jgi:hypothetical protein